MELVLKNADVFKKSMEAIAVLIDEAELVINQNGLELKATDPSQISMVDFSMPSTSFEKFDVVENRLGLDLDYLNQVLSRAQGGDSLTLSIDEKKAFLSVTFKGNAQRSFQVPLIDISTSEVPNPRIEFDSELLISASFLQNAFKDAALISSHLVLGCSEDKFFVKANSSKGNLNEELAENKDSLPEFRVKRECRSMFPLDYLQDMLKAASSDTKVNLFLKSSAPIRISYKIGDASISYFLAPRIENS
ncbi:MAG: proliferating cell nuclear antigen (pcna) [Candidatus ainarchaeum sp.]|jgi:proliferating cell nuclear antigen|nr:proliferating cell nuclear antigen (pcna) [Candidatus ainarchaeum sp.]MDD3085998.1 proliferating cell nuclear antigen (pcna) [Candidatus ainarchaeum sp.]MDD4128643.1 proliferating cell nuclear antigen (pcna) [Candidatus ainarchaeum sp.]MDD4467959.1 proliferating cell nuclear antigen (pcna) [Candidatus ainarchaeum sp.]HPM85848.1 proliferating cell nuclear antigen (pcna) [archaeon]